MSKTTAISLDDELAGFVERPVAEGRYAEAHLDALRAALIAGEESGPPEPFDVDAHIAGKLRGAG